MWMPLVFIGVLLHSITNHIDNFLVSQSEKTNHVSTGSLIIFSAFAGVFGVILALIFGTGFFDVGMVDRLLLIGVGCIELCAVLLYLYALESEEVTSITLWWSITPLITLAAGWLLLGESITQNQGIGIGIIVLASIFLAFKKSEMKYIFKGRIVALMIGSSLCYGVMNVLFKFVSVSESAFWLGSFWQYIGMVLCGCLFYLCSRNYREGFHILLNESGPTMLSGNILNELLYLSGIGLVVFAALRAPVVLVSAAENIQPLFVLLLSFVISKFIPNYDADDLSRNAVIKKLLLIGFMSIGLYLIG